MRETKKWFTQAEEDLKAAKDSLKSGHYNWACFQAQQSAEKTLKFFLYSQGYTSIITHSIKELVRVCNEITYPIQNSKRIETTRLHEITRD